MQNYTKFPSLIFYYFCLMNINFPALMGVVNCTPDSFFSGSRVNGPREALNMTEQHVQEGADIIDIGACSTRPGADWPSEDEEWKRLEPVLKQIRTHFPKTVFSLDTFRPGIVEKAAPLLGHFVVNDIFAGNYDKAMLPLISALKLPWIAMHREPYRGPEGITRFFRKVAEQAEKYGINEFILDPGFGFNKDVDQNFEVITALPSLVPKDDRGKAIAPLLAGISRKRLTYMPLGTTPENALLSTEALHLQMLFKGVSILRVHDVAEARQMITLYRKMSTFVN
jgi:dihydropteroate synthase